MPRRLAAHQPLSENSAKGVTAAEMAAKKRTEQGSGIAALMKLADE